MRSANEVGFSPFSIALVAEYPIPGYVYERSITACNTEASLDEASYLSLTYHRVTFFVGNDDK